ncbi:MAG: Kelch repeat-containing protein [Planctomycetota bacterium]|jgi:hypothetical protein
MMSVYKWEKITEQAPFLPRDGAGLLPLGNKMYLIGGWGGKRDKVNFPRICSNEVWVTENGLDWEQIKPNTFLDDTFDTKQDWEGRHTGGYAVLGDKMWLVGGDMNQGHYQPDVWNSENGSDWNLVSSAVPWGSRGLHHTIAFQNKLWVMGGQTMPGFVKDSSETVLYNDVWNSSDGKNWQQVAEKSAWQPRGMIGGQVVFNDRMWLLGGGTYDTPDRNFRDFYNDVWSSSDGINWECHLENAPWEPRQYHETAVFDGKMWVLEGYDKEEKNRNDVWFSENGTDWHELPGSPWLPRHAACISVFQDSLWLAAGNNMTSDIWRLVK